MTGGTRSRKVSIVSSAQETSLSSRRGVRHSSVPSKISKPVSDGSSCSQAMCAATPVPSAWPNLSIVPEELGSRIATAMGGRDIDFELESFNREFQVRSDDPRFAHALVDARIV
jgi:hypothetical protein